MYHDSEEISKATEIIKAAQAVTGRSCGECSMCCKLLKIDEIEISKPANQWCKHCRPGAGGCMIYDDRPPVCHGFACLWLVDPTLNDEWKPSHSKIVIHMKLVEGVYGSDKIITDTGGHSVLPVGDGEWKVMKFDTQDEARAAFEKINSFITAIDSMSPAQRAALHELLLRR
jgi:hypothetical protein